MSRAGTVESLLAGAIGAWLALTLIKFGNPVILDYQVPAPTTLEELLVSAWPIVWGYLLSGALLLAGVFVWRPPQGAPRWLLVMPLLWLGWQGLSFMLNVGAVPVAADRRAMLATLGHFTVCTMVFYFGAGLAGRTRRLRLLWLGLVGGFLVILAVGWGQHFGGLDETREFFFKLPDWRSYPPEFIQKLSSDRIYGTLFYPNALAGVILLLLPVCLAQIWAGREYLSRVVVWTALGGVTTLALGCLYWSGSKAGWLLFVGQCLVAVLRSAAARRTKLTVLAAIGLVGLAGFALRYQAYFAKGATSLSARFDYWQAAWQGLKDKPMAGSGPGTFAATYRRLKPPEAEMARLVHNDFLQQGSDSGWIGLLAYGAWLLGGVGFLARYSKLETEPVQFGIWLGLLGITCQGFMEFWLYIPAIAWTTFFLFGLRAGEAVLFREQLGDE